MYFTYRFQSFETHKEKRGRKKTVKERKRKEEKRGGKKRIEKNFEFFFVL